MLNVNELESRWLKYKIKAYVPYVTITIGLAIISVVIYSVYGDMRVIKEVINIKAIEIEDKVVKVAKPIKVEQKIERKIERKIEKNLKKKKIILAPSFDFINEIKHSAIPSYNNIQASVKSRKIVKPKPKPRIEQKLKPKLKLKIEQKEIKESNRVKIKKQNTQKDISHIIKRFKKNSNPALSLFVAKKYYELGNYSKSYEYALITNGINNDIEASWIIFAKSLVKLKKKDSAIKILKSYIKYSHSSQAQILLEEITSGEFR